ncbi:MAG: hypothetical protein RLZZ458_941 [Planctomycetota bacterium]
MHEGVVEAASTTPICRSFGGEQIDMAWSSECINEATKGQTGNAFGDSVGDAGPGHDFSLMIRDLDKLSIGDAAAVSIVGVEIDFESSFAFGMALDVAVAGIEVVQSFAGNQLQHTCGGDGEFARTGEWIDTELSDGGRMEFGFT